MLGLCFQTRKLNTIVWRANCLFLLIYLTGFQISARAGDVLEAEFFYTPGCRMCKEAKDAVRKAESLFGEKISVKWIDLSEPEKGVERAERLFSLLDAYGITETPSIALFAGHSCLSGGESISLNIEKTLQNELNSGNFLLLSSSKNVEEKSRLSFWSVAPVALADGVNPCAFATVVLLVSLMTTAGRTRREKLMIGVGFTLAVYVTYFFIGLFLFQVLQRLTAYFLVSDLIYWAAFLLCICGGVLSLYDAVIAARGCDLKDMALKLPGDLRERIRKRLSAGVRARSLLVAAFSAGVAVSFLEAACTGQVYFPVIAGLVKESDERLHGILLLIWYNFLFVLPLMAVFALSLAGVGSSRIASETKKRVALVKIILTLVFAGMAWWMSEGLIWPPGTR